MTFFMSFLGLFLSPVASQFLWHFYKYYSISTGTYSASENIQPMGSPPPVAHSDFSNETNNVEAASALSFLMYTRDLSTCPKAFFFASLHFSELVTGLSYSVPQVKSRKHAFKMYQHLCNITHYMEKEKEKEGNKKGARLECRMVSHSIP